MLIRSALLAATLALATAAATDQPAYDSPPINYSKATPADPIASLQTRIASGKTALAHDADHGYLKAVLAALDIPASSQTLVFSKTSFQRHKINPRAPRALYFNDDVYIGWVRGGDVVEVSSVDPQLGAIFYTLSQKPVEAPRFVRHTDTCLQCHDSTGQTLGVPGHIVRSVYPGEDGMPHFQMGTFRTTFRSPFAERWGGWYVTGDAGPMRHLGNVTFSDEANPEPKAFPVKDLSPLARIEAYLSNTSDITALLVLEHQALVHNLITRANHQTRIAVLQSEEINKLSGTPGGPLTEGARSRIRANAEPLVEALLFSGEAPLAGRVRGNSTFTADFEKRGPFDAKGRTLRQFDLEKRMFRFPCSYLIYSKAFAGLPPAAKEYLSKRLRDILLGRDGGKEYAHLSAEDRAAIFEILCDTLPEFTAGWK